jgi:hypothetical protein
MLVVFSAQFYYAEKRLNTCAHNALACVGAGVTPHKAPKFGSVIRMATIYPPFPHPSSKIWGLLLALPADLCTRHA